jgi:predicted amidohydrolase YtcJ
MPNYVIKNAKVYIERGKFAEAVLTEGGRIAAVGTNDEIAELAPRGVETIDAGGKLLTPGFSDSHQHFLNLGQSLKLIMAYGAKNMDDIIKAGKETIARIKPKKGDVVLGQGWNQDLMAEKRFPTRRDIDKISTEIPIIIDRVCCHICVANTAAIKAAGFDKGSSQIEGGHFDTEEDGYPNGIFRENAMWAIKKIVPPLSDAEVRSYLEYAGKTAIQFGVTSAACQDINNENWQQVINAYKVLQADKALCPRITQQTMLSDPKYFDEFVANGWKTGSMITPYLKVGPMKLFSDGSLGSDTAFMRKPYKNDPSTRGIHYFEQDELNALVQKFAAHGFQVAIHAIGDGGIEMVVKAFETVTKPHFNPLRHAVIHLQITDMPLLERLAARDIIVMAQPIFLTHDLYIADGKVGKELASTSYAWKTLEKLGVHAGYGTDSPVETLNPLHGIDCAVNRQDVEGKRFPDGGWNPQECLDVYTALDNYTAGSAYCTFEEKVNGRIKPGYYADMVLLDKDILTCPKDEIKDAKVLFTMMDGNILYRS